MRIKDLIISILIGFIVGIATVFGQKYLPGALNSVANSGSVWVIPAFYIGARQKDKLQSMAFSVVYLIMCVMTYYGYYSIIWSTGFTMSFHQAVWLVCAIVFGIVFGLAGYLSQNGNTKLKYPCKTILPAAFIAESLTFISHFKHYTHMVDVIVMWLVVGSILYFINCKTDWNSKQCFLSLFIMIALGFIGYQIVYYSDKLIFI